MDENKEVERYKWDIDVIVTHRTGGSHTIHIAPSDYMTEKEIEKAVEHIATHGVWQKESLIPPHRVYQVSVYKAGEEKNVYQG